MAKISVKHEAEEVDLGEKLRDLIIRHETEKEEIELRLVYHGAEQEQPGTILSNLEKIGIINWISPQFKTPSWALPLAQFSKLRCESDLWYLLMDTYKFVRVVCDAQNFLSTRIRLQESTPEIILHCFRPLPITTTYGYASLSSNHFTGGSDVKAINLRRENCDSSRSNMKNASLTPELYDELQKKVWYPEKEICCCATVLEREKFCSVAPQNHTKIATLTHYLFEKDGLLCKTIKSNVTAEVSINSAINSEGGSTILGISKILTGKKNMQRFESISLGVKHLVITTAGQCEVLIRIDVIRRAGFQEDETKKIVDSLLTEVSIPMSAGMEQSGSLPNVLQFLHIDEITITEYLMEKPVFSGSLKQNPALQVCNKTSGSFQGTLKGSYFKGNKRNTTT